MAKISVVTMLPTQTTNITGFFAISTGLSFANASPTARLTMGGSNKGRDRLPAGGTGGAVFRGGVACEVLSVVAIMFFRTHLLAS